VARPTPCDIGAVQLTLALQEITSADTATATVGSAFSATVTTSGTPTPTLKKTGPLPKHVTFVNNGDGTATIAGTPTIAGTYLFTVTATFGTGHTKNVLAEVFTVTVDPST
jgi:hypothetical protein